ncbi:Gfo/Idh/MocA family oxidoreductase (plasmid) [Kitasatospora sp. NBC_00374]|uniref:Gfo/Idh/MocA family protein n=1 Tax=Kitasatospora sp. NBC_00374 TaxID=2975964 RepID=UPI002F90F1A4
MRTLLVGCGNQGGQTLLPAALAAGIEVTALVDSDLDRAARLARQWSVPDAFASVEDLDTGAFEAAIIALPVDVQGAHARWALEQRLHTFVEKPPAPDLARLRELSKTAHDAGVTAAVGMNFRWADGVLALLGALESGCYGQASYVRVVHVARKPVVSFSADLTLEASLFHAQGVHAIDLAALLRPGATAISGQMLAVERGRLCLLAGDNTGAGQRFEARFGSCAAGFHHQVEVLTDSGDQLLLRDLAELALVPGGGRDDVGDYPGARVLWRRSPISAGYAGAGYAPELTAFKERVQGDGAPLLATVDDLVPTYEAFDALLAARGLEWTA